MELSIAFFFNSILLGIGLAMDAFSVSLANGLNNPCMKKRKICIIAGTFAFFQALMPMLGWLCVHTFVQYFKNFETFIPYIALILLSFIGGKMLYDSIRNKKELCNENQKIGFWALIVQGIATSIDALSVGFTIAEYNLLLALLASSIIAIITFIICFCGVLIGKKAGMRLADRSGIFGGLILIFIGLEIFISNVF